MTDFDPTKNEKPFGLLTLKNQEIMANWPHGLEMFTVHGWRDVLTQGFSSLGTYRGKPAPVVTSVWLNVYPSNASLPYKSRVLSNSTPCSDLRIAVLRIDTCNGVTNAHLEDV